MSSVFRRVNRLEGGSLRSPHSPSPSLPEGERGTRGSHGSEVIPPNWLFSLLSLWERRAGEVRASKRIPLQLAMLILAFLLAACGDGRTPLVVYSPHGRDLLTLMEKSFEKDHPDVDVRWLDMGSQEVYDRVRSEAANPQADVWYGGPQTIFSPRRGGGPAGALPAGMGRLRARGEPGPGGSLLRRLPHRAGAGLQLGGREARGGARRLGRPARAALAGQDPDPRSPGERHHADALRHGPGPFGPGDGKRGAGMAVAPPAGRADQGVRAEPGAAHGEAQSPGGADHRLGADRHALAGQARRAARLSNSPPAARR